MPKKKSKTTQSRPKKRRAAKALKADKRLKAKHPGTRKAASGTKYSERRPNRSDVNRAKKL